MVTAVAKKILVAVAWPYASGPRHLGHVAGFGVPSDVFARFQRMKGNDVLMVSGTDEHGTPITVRAESEGKTPQQVVDYYNQTITDNLATLGCSYNLFTRTTTDNHYAVTQDMFARLRANGYMIRGSMMGMYSEDDKRFLPDRYVEGTCPHCGYTEARGDQCDNCGRQLDPDELIDPHSRITGTKLVYKETEHFFLDLPAFADRLRSWISAQDHWRPNVRNFSLGLIDEGLRRRAMTRDIDWGIPIPDLPTAMEGKRIYVWFDAVIGYLSASKEWAAAIAGTPDSWTAWWQDPDVHHYYFMGKDNMVFHSVIWPAMLMGYGGLNLPYDVVASEFLTMEGKRFSTSRGLAVWLPDYFSRYDADPLRYYLMINGPETSDTDFSWAEFLRRNNDELVATWGNLAHRVLTFTFKNFGAVPDPGALTSVDLALLAQADAAFSAVGAELDACHFRSAITRAMSLAQSVNQYLDQTAPWQTIKVDRPAAARALYVALRLIDSLKILLCPFLPHSSQKLHTYLGYDGYISGPLEFKTVTESSGKSHRVLTCDPSTWIGRWEPSRLAVGQQLRQPEPLFKKLDVKIVDEEVARMVGQ
jgi:methionyl-tRNA synthetase